MFREEREDNSMQKFPADIVSDYETKTSSMSSLLGRSHLLMPSFGVTESFSGRLIVD